MCRHFQSKVHLNPDSRKTGVLTQHYHFSDHPEHKHFREDICVIRHFYYHPSPIPWTTKFFKVISALHCSQLLHGTSTRSGSSTTGPTQGRGRTRSSPSTRSILSNYDIEKYISHGLTKAEAKTYMESLKTQEKLSKIMSMNDNQRKNGGQNFNFTETSPTSQVLP